MFYDNVITIAAGIDANMSNGAVRGGTNRSSHICSIVYTVMVLRRSLDRMHAAVMNIIRYSVCTVCWYHVNTTACGCLIFQTLCGDTLRFFQVSTRTVS